MKNLKLWIIGGVAAIAVLVCFILAVPASGDKNAAKESELRVAQTKVELYREQIDKLEKEIGDLKEEQYLMKQEYEDRLEQLKTEVDSEKTVVNVPVVSDAEYTYTVNGNTITITDYVGTDKKLTIPAEIDGLEVAAIGREAFKGSSFTEVVLPSSLKTIDWFAFASCSCLNKIYIPAGVNKIEYGAFDGTDNIVVVCTENSYAYRYAKSYGFAIETK